MEMSRWQVFAFLTWVAIFGFSLNVEATFQSRPLGFFNLDYFAAPLVVAVNGRPAIVFIADQSLRFIRAADSVGSVWPTHYTTMALPESNGSPIAKYVFAAIINGHPAATYYATLHLKYIRASDSNGEVWPTEAKIIRPCCRDYLPMLIESGVGVPAIGFQDIDAPNYYFATANDANGDSWNPVHGLYESETHQAVYGFPPSLAAINGFPAVVLTSGARLKFIRALSKSGTDLTTDMGPHAVGYQWGPLITVDNVNVPSDNKLLDVGGKPAIAYTIRVGSDIRILYTYAADTAGTVWPPAQMVTAGPNFAPCISMALIRGKPAILFYDEAAETLMLAIAAENEGIHWSVRVVATRVAHQNTVLTATVTEVNGIIGIAFKSLTGELMYAFESPECEPCDPKSPSCWYPGVASAGWCIANCRDNRYGGACTPAFCSCPADTSANASAPACRACNSADPSCLGTATDRWCEANCQDGQYLGACLPTMCVCPNATSVPRPPVNPCVPCTKLTDPSCMKVANEAWCKANCLEGRYGGSCQPNICFCPSA